MRCGNYLSCYDNVDPFKRLAIAVIMLGSLNWYCDGIMFFFVAGLELSSHSKHKGHSQGTKLYVHLIGIGFSILYNLWCVNHSYIACMENLVSCICQHIYVFSTIYKLDIACNVGKYKFGIFMLIS